MVCRYAIAIGAVDREESWHGLRRLKNAGMWISLCVTGMLAVSATPAHAADYLRQEGGVLAPGEAVYSLKPDPVYQVNMPGPWSVVAARGGKAYRSNLDLYDGAGGRHLAAAHGQDDGRRVTNWIAVNADKGGGATTFTAAVSQQTPTTIGLHTVQFAAGGASLSVNSDAAQPLGFPYDPEKGGFWLVDVRDVWLTSGTKVRFTVDNISKVSLLYAASNDPASWVGTRDTAQAPSKVNSDGSYTFTITHTGRYGVVFESEDSNAGLASVRVKVESFQHVTLPCRPPFSC
jgi:hypothetical protein